MRVLFVNPTSIVVPLWPVKFARSPAAAVNAELLTVALTEVPALRASIARLLPLLANDWLAPKVVPPITSVEAPETLTTERFRARPPLTRLWVMLEVPLRPFSARPPK